MSVCVNENFEISTVKLPANNESSQFCGSLNLWICYLYIGLEISWLVTQVVIGIYLCLAINPINKSDHNADELFAFRRQYQSRSIKKKTWSIKSGVKFENKLLRVTR